MKNALFPVLLLLPGIVWAQGGDNKVIIRQVGPSSRAHISQSGERNSLMVDQTQTTDGSADFQKAITESPFTTIGRANTAIVSQFGDENSLTGEGDGKALSGNRVTAIQKGKHNDLEVKQRGKDNHVSRSQSGGRSRAKIQQNDERNIIIDDKVNAK